MQIPRLSKAKLHHVGGSPNHPVVLFLHGFGADSLSWSFVAPAFCGTHSVWSVDLPGHGTAGSDVASGDVAVLARAVLDCLDENTSRPFAIVGHSLGGAIALELDRILEHAPRHLILLAPAGLGAPPNPAFLARFCALQTEQDALNVLRDMVQIQRLITPQMAGYVLRSLQMPGRRDALICVADRLVDHRYSGALDPERVTCAWGEHDKIIPIGEIDPAHKVAGFHQLTGIGHLPQAEAVQKLIRLMNGVLAHG